MKFKSKAWIGLVFGVMVAWPLLAPNYSTTQILLAGSFSYLGVTLIQVILNKNKEKE